MTKEVSRTVIYSYSKNSYVYRKTSNTCINKFLVFQFFKLRLVTSPFTPMDQETRHGYMTKKVRNDIVKLAPTHKSMGGPVMAPVKLTWEMEVTSLAVVIQ